MIIEILNLRKRSRATQNEDLRTKRKRQMVLNHLAYNVLRLNKKMTHLCFTREKWDNFSLLNKNKEQLIAREVAFSSYICKKIISTTRYSCVLVDTKISEENRRLEKYEKVGKIPPNQNHLSTLMQLKKISSMILPLYKN